MKNLGILLGIGVFVLGLIALYQGILAMDAPICFSGDACAGGPANVWLFPVGLAAVILGCILWTAVGGTLTGGNSATGAGTGGSGSSRANPLSSLGFFGIFGLSFL